MNVALPITENRPLSIWRNKSFVLLLSSTFLLSIGNKIYELLLPLILYELTHSPIAVTTMRTAELLPNLLFGIFIGVLVDRSNKKNWAMWAVGLQGFLLVGLALLLKREISSLIPYYAIGFLLMTFNYSYFNAQVGLIKGSVPMVHLNSANAKFSFIETFVNVMGPVISGFILFLPFFYDGILFTAAAYFLGFFLISQMPGKFTVENQAKSDFRKDLIDGWNAFRGNAPLFLMTIFILALNATMTVVQTSVVIFAKDELQLASSTVAAVIASSGIGGMAASLFASRLRKKIGIGVLFGLSALFHALSYLGLYFSMNLFLLILSLFAGGMATAIYSVSAYTFRLEQTPQHLIGRISGITGTIFRIGMPVSVYFSGWVIHWQGTGPVFLVSAFINILLFFIYKRTQLWKLK